MVEFAFDAKGHVPFSEIISTEVVGFVPSDAISFSGELRFPAPSDIISVQSTLPANPLLCRCGHAKVGHRTVPRLVSLCEECNETCDIQD